MRTHRYDFKLAIIDELLAAVIQQDLSLPQTFTIYSAFPLHPYFAAMAVQTDFMHLLSQQTSISRFDKYIGDPHQIALQLSAGTNPLLRISTSCTNPIELQAFNQETPVIVAANIESTSLAEEADRVIDFNFQKIISETTINPFIFSQDRIQEDREVIDQHTKQAAKFSQILLKTQGVSTFLMDLFFIDTLAVLEQPKEGISGWNMLTIKVKFDPERHYLDLHVFEPEAGVYSPEQYREIQAIIKPLEQNPQFQDVLVKILEETAEVFDARSENSLLYEVLTISPMAFA